MWTSDDFNKVDETLGVQLRLALASPLWKSLPHGAQINPRDWRIELLEARRKRRLCVRVTVPWRTGHQANPPLGFIMVIWHKQHAHCLHRAMQRLNERLGLNGRERRLMFYDSLSHAFIGQYLSPRRGNGAEGAPRFSSLWARSLIGKLQTLLGD